MSSAWRLVVHCDVNATDQCAGLLELPGTAPADAITKAGWLHAFRGAGTYDVCPSCRVKIEKQTPPKEKADA